MKRACWKSWYAAIGIGVMQFYNIRVGTTIEMPDYIVSLAVLLLAICSYRLHRYGIKILPGFRSVVSFLGILLNFLLQQLDLFILFVKALDKFRNPVVDVRSVVFLNLCS